MSGPLQGVKIIEIAGIGPGPFAAMMLADMGAEIVRVDRAQSVSGNFDRPNLEILNRGRRSIGVDLKQPEGVETVLQARRAGRRAHRGLPARRGRAPEHRPRRVPRPQPEARLRPHDRLGSGRSLRAGRRSRHQLHRARRRARALRPGRLEADAADQRRRRLRRRRDAHGVRRRVRPRGVGPLGQGPGDRRGDGRRLGRAHGDDVGLPGARHLGRVRHQRARHRRAVLRHLRDGRRQVHLARRARAAVLRRADQPRSASPTTSTSPVRWTTRPTPSCASGSPRCSRPRRATSGARSSSTPTRASRRCSRWPRPSTTRTSRPATRS